MHEIVEYAGAKFQFWNDTDNLIVTQTMLKERAPRAYGIYTGSKAYLGVWSICYGVDSEKISSAYRPEYIAIIQAAWNHGVRRSIYSSGLYPERCRWLSLC